MLTQKPLRLKLRKSGWPRFLLGGLLACCLISLIVLELPLPWTGSLTLLALYLCRNEWLTHSHEPLNYLHHDNDTWSISANNKKLHCSIPQPVFLTQFLIVIDCTVGSNTQPSRLFIDKHPRNISEFRHLSRLLHMQPASN